MRTYLYSHIEHCLKFAEPWNKKSGWRCGIVVLIMSMGVVVVF